MDEDKLQELASNSKYWRNSDTGDREIQILTIFGLAENNIQSWKDKATEKENGTQKKSHGSYSPQAWAYTYKRIIYKRQDLYSYLQNWTWEASGVKTSEHLVNHK